MHGGVFEKPLPGKNTTIQERIAELEKTSGTPDFWNDTVNAEKAMGELKALKSRWEPWKGLKADAEDLQALLELAVEAEDESQSPEIEASLKSLSERFEKQNLLELMSGEVDRNGCFLTIHSGAGGTEACDWSQMLYRMYLRWAERRGFSVEGVDMLEAEGGIKSAACKIEGA
jgi:peptide chain release factor 2